MRTLSMILLVLASATLVACKNANYCEGNVNNDCRSMADPDGGPDMSGPACTSSAQCEAPTPVCDTSGGGACVQCIAPDETAACTGTTPICDAAHTCRACEAHAECASQLCLPDGSCGDQSQIAYVAKAGTGTDCTLAAPCPLLADALAKDLPYVKIAATGTANASSSTIIDGQAVTIFAEPGASMDRDGDGPLLEVRSADADVTIYGLKLTGANGSSGVGATLTPNGGNPKLTLIGTTITNNQGGGLAITGGFLTVSRSTISLNQAGGISITGAGSTFSITNSFIYRNGDENSGTYGGVNIGIATAGSNVFEFNTVTDNQAAINGGGVICNIATFTAPNNIIARNEVGGSTSAAGAQTSGACTYPSSLVQNDVSGLAFVDAEVPAPFDYRILTGSTAIDAATTTSSVVIDHDGDARPQGANKDIGADELKP